MNKDTHGSLFSGLGGFDLAAEIMGYENLFNVEIDPFCRRILNFYWPQSKSYENIITTDFTVFKGRIKILTGGFPCQPYSTAGKRQGTEDERHLWPQMLRAIREIQPPWVIAENVLGLVNWNGGLVFNEVQSDLENEGYEVQSIVLPAAGVNAPHGRARVWFIAYSHNFRLNWERSKSRNKKKTEKVRASFFKQSFRFSGVKIITYAQCFRRIQSISTGSSKFIDSNGKKRRIIAYTNIARLQKRSSNTFKREPGQFRRLFSPKRFDVFPTQSPICGGNDGLSSELDGITFSNWRRESIKGYGNAIVPIVPIKLFNVIEKYEARYK